MALAEIAQLQKEAYSYDEAAQVAGIGRTILYKMVGEGRLPVRKLGKRSLILRSDLTAFLQSLPTGQ